VLPRDDVCGNREFSLVCYPYASCKPYYYGGELYQPGSTSGYGLVVGGAGNRVEVSQRLDLVWNLGSLVTIAMFVLVSMKFDIFLSKRGVCREEEEDVGVFSWVD